MMTPIDISTNLPALALLAGVGCVGGFLSGLLGIGGGMIFVPALYFVFGIAGVAHAMHLAVGTSLALVAATGLVSARSHGKRGACDRSVLKHWAPFIVVGVAAGAYFAGSVDGAVLKKIFATLTLVMALYIAFSGEKPPTHAKPVMPVWAQRLCCFAIGMISSMIGVGGAVLTIPLMTFNGVPMQKAVGTGAALGVAVAFPAMLGYMVTGYPHMSELPPLSLGYVSGAAALAVIPASMLLAPVGVHVSHRLPRLLLRRIFAGVVALVSLRMFLAM